MEEGSQADWEGQWEHDCDDFGTEDEVNDNNNSVEWLSLAGAGDSELALDSEVVIPPQEPTRAFPPQSATPNVEEVFEIPEVEMAMDVDVTAGLETLTGSQEEPSTQRPHGPGNGEFRSV